MGIPLEIKRSFAPSLSKSIHSGAQLQSVAATPAYKPFFPEAQAIERRLSGVVVKRPQTHDLLANVIRTLGAEVESVTVTDLADGTFYATLDVRTAEGEPVHIDSRPSDAIAIGIGLGVPIYVEEHVLEGVQDGEPG